MFGVASLSPCFFVVRLEREPNRRVAESRQQFSSKMESLGVKDDLMQARLEVGPRDGKQKRGEWGELLWFRGFRIGEGRVWQS